ncbi:hypothetical protein [Pseudoduganella rhizocola]|uniref:hypothetical protein n=1 Tax=Pseudoduganella rhizocola TaxID=3382643 RepID=UPI0038B4B333
MRLTVPCLAAATLKAGLLLSLCCAGAARADVRYTARVLAELQPTRAALNDAGQVAGHISERVGSVHQDVAVRMEPDGSITRMGTVRPGERDYVQWMQDISSSGASVASYWNDSVRAFRPIMWDAQGKAHPIEVRGTSNSGALALNDAGTVVGYTALPGSVSLTFGWSWHNGRQTMLDVGPYVYAMPSDINAAGVIAGGVYTGAHFDPALWRDGALSLLPTYGYGGGASVITRSGLVGGWADDAQGLRHAVMWRGGELVDLGTGFSFRAMNDAGVAIGISYPGNGWERAMLWRDGQLFELDALWDNPDGWKLGSVFDINDQGQILAQRFHPTQYKSGVVLLTPVPEPASAAMLAAGLFLLVPGRRASAVRPWRRGASAV